ncbi:MAG: hypothetical protein NT062_10350 [Proteobacteria bacterium]|nr:hypothetical protein [Pseudomonadota bacterium]
MNKLALAFAASLLVAAPAVACPGMEGHDEAAPKTAEKAKDAPKKTDAAKPAPKATEKKDDTKTAKPVEKTEKKTDKVSSR